TRSKRDWSSDVCSSDLYSKSDTARKPRSKILASWSVQKCASNFEKPTTLTLDKCVKHYSAKLTRSSMENSGRFASLSATATMTTSNMREARSIKSLWPLVMGSKVPG